MATVVLTEKPSVARDIARVLGANKRAQGYAEGNGYIVTWALGHLVQFAEPDDYGPPWKGRWSFAQLPMIPEQWKLKTTRSTSDQYQIVKKLLNSPSDRARHLRHGRRARGRTHLSPDLRTRPLQKAI